MAPSEFDLRAALAEGEGDTLDPDHVVVAGRVRRAQRRSRILSTVAAVTLVGAGAFGISQLGGTSGDRGGADSAAGAPGALHRKAGGHTSALDYGAQGNGSVVGGAGVLAPRAALQALATTACPTFATADALVSDAADAGQLSRAGRVFGSAVSSAVVCAYGSTRHAAAAPPRTPARLELVGAPAVRLATSIESAPTTTSPGPCGQGVPNRYAFVALGTRGQQVGTVTADLGTECAAIVTNGTAVRYDWHPPPSLARRLVALTPMGVPASPGPSPTR